MLLLARTNIVRPNIVRRFTNTQSKIIFTENNIKIIEDLIREQNIYLSRISFGLLGIQACIIFKPIK
jgi:hypothetical protein